MALAAAGHYVTKRVKAHVGGRRVLNLFDMDTSSTVVDWTLTSHSHDPGIVEYSWGPAAFDCDRLDEDRRAGELQPRDRAPDVADVHPDQVGRSSRQAGGLSLRWSYSSGGSQAGDSDGDATRSGASRGAGPKLHQTMPVIGPSMALGSYSRL
jgi:hypothetical protein